MRSFQNDLFLGNDLARSGNVFGLEFSELGSAASASAHGWPAAASAAAEACAETPGARIVVRTRFSAGLQLSAVSPGAKPAAIP